MSELLSLALPAVIGGLFALITQWLASRIFRRKTDAEADKYEAEAQASKADAADTLSQAAERLIRPMDEKITALEKALADQQQLAAAQQQTIAAQQQTITATQKALEDVLIRVRVLETALCEAESELTETVNERDQVIDGATNLHDQVVMLGAEPVYKPPAKKSRPGHA